LRLEDHPLRLEIIGVREESVGPIRDETLDGIRHG
jgi:hypothetical protein